MSKSYLVNMVDGYAYVRNSGSSDYLATAAEAFELADAIISTALLMLNQNKDMKTLKKEYAATKIRNLLKTYGLTQGGHEEVLKGVYFLTANEYPNLIKIGKSNNTSIRAKQISKENFDTETEILYALVCNKPLETEYLLHILFEEYKVFGEWFDKEAVLQFINPYVLVKERKLA